MRFLLMKANDQRFKSLQLVIGHYVGNRYSRSFGGIYFSVLLFIFFDIFACVLGLLNVVQLGSSILTAKIF